MKQGTVRRGTLILAGVFGLVVLFTFYHQNYLTPVLMYHHIDYWQENSGNSYVTPETFERQMEFLKAHRYNVIPLRELVELRKQGIMPYKTVAITFDDGYVDNIKNAFPVLRKMEFPATVFVITEKIGEEGYLSEEDLKVLEEGGVSIGSHTVTHSYLPNLQIEAVRIELVDSKQRLEEILGHPVLLLSYPVGGYTGAAQEIARKAGYEAAFTTNRSFEYDPYALRRVKVSESSGSLFSFLAKISGVYHVGKKRFPADTYS